MIALLLTVHICLDGFTITSHVSLTTLLQPQPGAVTRNRRGSRHVSCGFIFCIHTSSECASIDEESWKHGMAASKVFWNFAGLTKKEG